MKTNLLQWETRYNTILGTETFCESYQMFVIHVSVVIKQYKTKEFNSFGTGDISLLHQGPIA